MLEAQVRPWVADARPWSLSERTRLTLFAVLLQMVFEIYQKMVSVGYQWNLFVAHQLRASLVHPQKAYGLELMLSVELRGSREDGMQMQKTPDTMREPQLVSKVSLRVQDSQHGWEWKRKVDCCEEAGESHSQPQAFWTARPTALGNQTEVSGCSADLMNHGSA
jgi:hypothetical protein